MDRRSFVSLASALLLGAPAWLLGRRGKKRRFKKGEKVCSPPHCACGTCAYWGVEEGSYEKVDAPEITVDIVSEGIRIGQVKCRVRIDRLSRSIKLLTMIEKGIHDVAWFRSMELPAEDFAELERCSWHAKALKSGKASESFFRS